MAPRASRTSAAAVGLGAGVLALVAVCAAVAWPHGSELVPRRGGHPSGSETWTWIFFGTHQILTAFVDLAALWAAILLTLLTFKKMSPPAAWLMVPYLAWVSFAFALNLAIWRLNS